MNIELKYIDMKHWQETKIEEAQTRVKKNLEESGLNSKYREVDLKEGLFECERCSCWHKIVSPEGQSCLKEINA